MLKFENVTLRFSETGTILNQVNAEFQRGMITGVFGGNGAGKSTLLRAVTTVFQPDSGRITLDGMPLKRNASYFSKLCYINSETRNLYLRLTGRQNMDYFHALFNVRCKKDWVERMAEGLQLKDALDRTISTYSMGMKQKLWMMINLLRPFEILCLDEYTDHIDDQAVEFTKRYFLEKEFLTHKIVIAVSRKLDTLSPLCNTLMRLENGNLV